MKREEMMAMLKEWIAELEGQDPFLGVADFKAGGYQDRYWYVGDTDTVRAKVRFDVLEE